MAPRAFPQESVEANEILLQSSNLPELGLQLPPFNHFAYQGHLKYKIKRLINSIIMDHVAHQRKTRNNVDTLTDYISLHYRFVI